jgi:hypothetical protein
MLAVPALLNAQAPSKSNAGPAHMGMSHGIATQIQGEAIAPEDINGADHQEGLNEKDGQNDDGDLEQGGVEEHGDLNNEVEDHAGQNDDGQDEGSTPAPAPAQSRIGHHKP